MYSYRQLGFMFRPIMSGGQGADKNSNTQQDCTRGDNQVQPPAHYVVAEEYTIGVPLFRVKPGLLQLLHTVGASGEIFTKKEICHFLKNYISSRHLYDPSDPRIVYCKDDPLQSLFGVEKFTINDALTLISKNCNQVPDTCIKRKYHYVTRPVHDNYGNPSQAACTGSNSNQTSVPTASSFRIEVCRASPIISSSTGPHSSVTKHHPDLQSSHSGASHGTDGQSGKVKVGSKRKRKDTSSSESSEGKRRPASVSITYSDAESSYHPWQVSVKMETSDDESEVLNFQDKENDNDTGTEEEEILSVEVNSDTFSVEYEVESENTDRIEDTDSTDNLSGQDVLVLCQDSDVEFWADMSEGGETDTELTDADKWSCSNCDTKNPPLERHCSLCWKLRPGWLPDKKSSRASNRKYRSSSLPGEVSSSESSDINRRHSFSKQRKSLSLATKTEYSSDSSVDRLGKTDINKDSFDSGIGASSATQPSSQEADATTKSFIESGGKGKNWSQTPLEKHCREKLGLESLEKTTACAFPQSAGPETSPSKLGIRRTFLNYRTKDDAFCISDKSEETLFIPLKTPCEKSARSGVVNSEKASGSDNLTCGGSTVDMCVICLCRPKTGSIIHGSTGHQVCCFRCARRLKRQRLACPVCRRPIQKVVKNFIL